MNFWFSRRSTKRMIFYSIVIAVVMALFKIYHAPEVIYFFLLGSSNFALGSWVREQQLRENGWLKK